MQKLEQLRYEQLFSPACQIFTQLFQRFSVNRGVQGGEGADQPPLEEVLLLIEGVELLLGLRPGGAGRAVGVLDADITGPSIPKAFGVHERAVGDERGILPAGRPQ